MKQSIFKILRIGFELFLIVVLFLGLYVFYGGYLVTTRGERSDLFKEIKASPQLPENVINMYEDNLGRCPCRRAAVHYNQNRRYRWVDDILLLWMILERNVSDKECLNYYLKDFDFANGIFGIQEASRYYYNKDLINLNNDELLELIVILENPVFYNKEKQNRVENLNKRVEQFKKKLKDKTT